LLLYLVGGLTVAVIVLWRRGTKLLERVRHLQEEVLPNVSAVGEAQKSLDAHRKTVASATGQEGELDTPAHKNLFPGALAHVRNWPKGRLEPRSQSPISSQALCISVFGSIAESPNCAALMDAILAEAGIELARSGKPEVECEVRGRREVLNEHGGVNPTCPDVLAIWPDSVLTVESKFTETLAPCLQIDTRACSGEHKVGSDLGTKTDAPCRLAVAVNKGKRGYRSARLYWEIGKQCFKPEVLAPPRSPCPFADGKFQLMRNLCFAAALAQAEKRQNFGFLLAYAGNSRSAAETAKEFETFCAMLLPDVADRVGSVTYEQIAEVLADNDEQALSEWLIKERLPLGSAT
jgi:hypothetical protein